MKVNFPEPTEISELRVGEPFLIDRNLYMIVGKSRGLTRVSEGFCLAVNLQSGQLRTFPEDRIITSVSVEITCKSCQA
jgi:hypothetical protein